MIRIAVRNRGGFISRIGDSQRLRGFVLSGSHNRTLSRSRLMGEAPAGCLARSAGLGEALDARTKKPAAAGDRPLRVFVMFWW
ncbi:hypothetical protein CGZ80_27350 [Rhodopirellula sp. MGV]|nr:hypothetical protein CGZ80_27350 [Rhodopirellula sp. MGV]